MHTFTTSYVVTRLCVIVATAMAVGAGITWGVLDDSAPVVSQPAPVVSFTIPTGSPSPSLPATEDSPGWDCRIQGNHVCGFGGELWLNVNHLPASLYARCLLGLGATGLSPEVASIDTAEICKPLYVNG